MSRSTQHVYWAPNTVQDTTGRGGGEGRARTSFTGKKWAPSLQQEQALPVLGRTEHDLRRRSHRQVPVLLLESNQKRPLLPSVSSDAQHQPWKASLNARHHLAHGGGARRGPGGDSHRFTSGCVLGVGAAARGPGLRSDARSCLTLCDSRD